MRHISVLLREMMEYLNPQPNENFIDATVGSGGHAAEILKATAPHGKLLGIDWDKGAIEGMRIALAREVFTPLDRARKARSSNGAGAPTRIKDLKIEIESNSALILDTGSGTRGTEPPRDQSGIGLRHIYQDRLVLVEGNFKNIKEIAAKANFKNIKGVLFDLGLRSEQLENSGPGRACGSPRAGRGFSYLKDEPLKMTFSEGVPIDAATVVNTWSPEKLERILKDFGQERNFRKISRTIIKHRQQRKITTTGELAEIVRKAAPYGGVKTLARTFQALRIAVNDELNNLKEGLEGAWEILARDGRLVIISFHSLEDRPVKNFFKEKERSSEGQILTAKPVGPTPEEIKSNPRSRSAKLRAIIKN